MCGVCIASLYLFYCWCVSRVFNLFSFQITMCVCVRTFKPVLLAGHIFHGWYFWSERVCVCEFVCLSPWFQCLPLLIVFCLLIASKLNEKKLDYDRSKNNSLRDTTREKKKTNKRAVKIIAFFFIFKFKLQKSAWPFKYKPHKQTKQKWKVFHRLALSNLMSEKKTKHCDLSGVNGTQNIM